MAFDIGRLRRGEKVAAVAAVLLFILMFFDWYTVSVSGGLLGGLSIGGSAWQAFGFIDIYLLVVILAAIGLAVLTATERSPALPVTASVIVTALAALGTLLVLYRLIDTPVGDVPDGVDVGRTIWAFLGLVAVAAVTYGGYLSMREEGTSFSDARDQARAAFDAPSSRTAAGGTSTPPPPPPAASEPPETPAPPLPEPEPSTAAPPEPVPVPRPPPEPRATPRPRAEPRPPPAPAPRKREPVVAPLAVPVGPTATGQPQPQPSPAAVANQQALAPLIPPRPVSGLASNRKPDYPIEARTRRQQGRVLLRVQVSATGNAASVDIVSSSGHPVLDQAARAAVRAWRFVPATRAGAAVAASADVPIEFRMDD